MRKIQNLLVLAILSTTHLPGAPGNDAAAETAFAMRKLEKLTRTLDRFKDSEVATSEGYVHYDGYDTFSMGEHWYNRNIYESGTCNGSRPSHLQYLVVGGKRTLIGTGYVCVPQERARPKKEIFGTEVRWHTHGPAWCLLPNGSAEDYRDLADALPNELTSLDWRSICQREGGVPAVQDVKMLHTWNWIPAPNGTFAHENLAIPFLRVGLPTPGIEFLESEAGKAAVRTLKLAHGDTQWWYWRAFNVINASDSQRQKGWRILQQARSSGQAVQQRMAEVGELQGENAMALAKSGERIIGSMHDQLAAVLSADQIMALNDYIGSLHTHVQHEQDHH